MADDPEEDTPPTDSPAEDASNGDTDHDGRHRISRRGLIAGGSAAAAITLVGGFVAGRTTSGSGGGTEPAHEDGRIHYRTTEATAPRMSVTQRDGGTASGLLFVTPQHHDYNGVIVDETGEPVWIEPSQKPMTDLRVQRFEGKDVLTYWSGEMYKHHGRGSCTILDDSYRTVAEVHAAGGLTADLHEFTLTDRGTALITAYGTTRADLRPIGGPKDGWVFEGHVQEIDVRSGKVLLDWASLDHVPVEDTYQGIADVQGQHGSTAAGAFDYFHVNAVDDDGDALLVSGRHTHTIYRIDRTSGEVLWRFGGRHSDIAVDEDARFAWQHHVRKRADDTITLFDNHLKTEAEGVYSRGMLFRVDEKARRATLVQAYSDDHLGTAMGNIQQLPDGHMMVGWGVSPHLTEFRADGTPIFDLDLGGKSYRAFRSPWKATPAADPRLVVAPTSGRRMHIHVSWNGATGVHRWRISAGRSAGHLDVVTTIARSGFESSAELARADAVQVEALDSSGALLGRSPVVQLRG